MANDWLEFDRRTKTNEQWKGEEKRKCDHSDDDTFDLISDTRRAIEEHKVEMEKLFSGVADQIEDNSKRIDEMSKSTIAVIEKQNALIKELRDMFNKAFPEGDAEAHRRAHESWIEKDKAEREMWSKLKQNTINWLVIAVLSWVGLILWGSFVQGPLK